MIRFNKAATFEKIGNVRKLTREKNKKHLTAHIATEMNPTDFTPDTAVLLIDHDNNTALTHVREAILFKELVTLKLKPFGSVLDVNLGHNVTAYKVDIIDSSSSPSWKDFILFLALFVMLFLLAALLFYGLADII